MPLRPLNRQQTWLLPPTLDELIPDDHPVRFVAMVVDSLASAFWQKLNIVIEGEPMGAPAYHPRALLCVWLYGFMTGIRSSRKLEAACRDQMTYLWLTGWQRPDHNTLWRFYKGHRNEMRHLFKLTVKTAVKMDLVDLAVQAVDGTKIAGNATKERTYDAKGLEKLLERTEKVIQELEKENEAGNDTPPAHLPEKLRKAEQLRTEVKAAIKKLEGEKERKQVNLTDGDANLMKGRHGFLAGYNLEAVVSPLKVNEASKSGLFMTAVEAVQDPDDHNQLVPMLKQAEENTGKAADLSLSDAGFHSGANLAECEKREQVIVMPEAQEQALKQPYHKDKFVYDTDTNSYQCPCGQTLHFVRMKLVHKKPIRLYRGSGAVCRKCPAFGTCTKDKHHGRELQVGEYEAEIRRHREWMATEEAKEAYKRRKELIEPVFGIIKEVMGIRRFLLRGLNNVQAEAVALVTAFNLRTLYGVWKAWASDKRDELFTTLQESRDNILDNSPVPSLLRGQRLLILLRV
jgi:transposase